MSKKELCWISPTQENRFHNLYEVTNLDMGLALMRVAREHGLTIRIKQREGEGYDLPEYNKPIVLKKGFVRLCWQTDGRDTSQIRSEARELLERS